MKNIFTLVLIVLSITNFSAQKYGKINDRINKLEANRVWDSGIIDVQLQGKKFSIVKNGETLAIQKILQIEDNNKITIIELIDDKKTNQQSSHIYSGNFIKNENNISIKADQLEGQKISNALVYNFILQRQSGVLYLHNINNNEKWKESEIVNK